jgi:hypothetical protein
MREFEVSDPFLDFLGGQLLPDSLEGVEVFSDIVSSQMFLDFDGSTDFEKISPEKKGERVRIGWGFRFEIKLFK